MGGGLKKGLIIGGIVVVLVFLMYSFFAGNYNKMVTLEENVSTAWSQVENVYQRRMDLIPNLVSTVKGYASHEKDLFTQITEARSKAGGVMNVSDEVLNNPESFARFQEAQANLGAAMQRLLVTVENYPDLKANENFLQLQSQLEGTENRIAVERRKFNQAAKEYNTVVRRFPASMIARMFGFERKAYFKATDGADAAPTVKF